MKTKNLNQQPSNYRKRECLAYRPNDFFKFFQESQNQILAHYQKSSQALLVSSLSVLIENIRHSINQRTENCKIQNKFNNNLMSKVKPNLTFKKQLKEINNDDQSTNPEQQIKELIHVSKTGKKLQKSIKKTQICKFEKQQTQKYSNKIKHQKLISSMNRLSVSEQFQLEQDMENCDQIQEPFMKPISSSQESHLKSKTISQLLSESQAKKDKIPFRPISPLQSEESQYQITDHESNQSSNGDYQQRFAYQSQNKSLFGNMFTSGINKMSGLNGFDFMNSQSGNSVKHEPLKLNFKPLLDSPKKQKTKKRLYINRKKVPKWATDLAQIQRIYASQQQRSKRENYLDTFGVCTVQYLQTNTVFNRNDQYNRASTAKWQKRKRGFII